MDMDKSLDELIDSGRNTKSGVVLRPAHESGTWTHAANSQQHGGGGGYHQHGKGTKGKQQTQTWNNLHAGASGGQHQNHYHGKGGAGGGAGNWNNGSPPHHSAGGPGRGAGWNAAPQVGSGWSNLQQAVEQPWHHGGKGQQGKGAPQNWNYAAHHGAGPPHHGNYKGGADGHWPGGSPPRPHHLQQGPPGGAGAGQMGVIRAFDKPRRGFGTGLLGGRRVQERKAARSTQVFFQKTGDLCVKLYDTEVCSFKKPSPKEKRGPVIQLNSGGFHTAETRFIISECLALVDFSIREKHSGVNLQANPNPTSKRLSLTANKNRAASSTDLAATDGGGTPSGPATQSQAGTIKVQGSSGEVDDAAATGAGDGEEDLQLSSSNGDGAFDEDAVVVAVPMKKRKRAASDEEGHDDLDFADEELEHVEDEELGPDGGESVRKTNSNVESFDGAGGAGDEEPIASSTMKTGTGSADVLAPPTADGMTAALPASGGQTGGEEKAARTAFLKEKLALKRKAEADRLQKHNTTVKGTTTSSTSTGEQPIKSSETTSSTSAANGNGKKVEVVVASSNKVTLASSKKGEPRKFAPWIVTGKSAAGEIFELDFYDGIEIALPMSFVPLGEFRNSLGSRFAMLAGGDPTAFHASQAPVIVHQRAGPLGGPPPAGAPPRGGGPPPRSAINVLNPAANGGGVAAVVTGSRSGLPPGAVAVQYVNAAGAPVGPPSTSAGALYRLPPGQQVEVLQHQGSAQQQIVHVVDAEELRWDRATAVGPSTDTNAGVRLVSAANVRAAQSSRAGPYSATTSRTKIFENDRILTASRQHQPAAERNDQKPVVAVAGARGGTTTTTGSSTSAAPLALQPGGASGRGAVPVVHRAPPEHTPYTVIQTVVNPDGSTTQYRAIHQTAAAAGSTAIQLPPGAAVGATAGTAVHQSARRATTTGAATYRIVQHANAHAAAIGSNGSIMQGAVVQPEQSKSVSKKRAAGAEVPVVAVMPDKTFVPQFQ